MNQIAIPLRVIVLLAAAFSMCLALAATLPTLAEAQQPPICQEYPNLPECQQDEGPTGGGGGQGPRQDLGPGAGGAGPAQALGPAAGAAAPTGAAAQGELPFTGYPVTPLLLLLLLLLLAGLTIRAYLAIRDRLRERDSGPSGTA